MSNPFAAKRRISHIHQQNIKAGNVRINDHVTHYNQIKWIALRCMTIM